MGWHDRKLKELQIAIKEIERQRLELIARFAARPKDVYVYTNTRYGFKEYKGEIDCIYDIDRLIINILPKKGNSSDKRIFTTTEEGTVKGATVWFYEEARDRAIELFAERDTKLSKEYINMSTQTISRIPKRTGGEKNESIGIWNEG